MLRFCHIIKENNPLQVKINTKMRLDKSFRYTSMFTIHALQVQPKGFIIKARWEALKFLPNMSPQ
jgi:hypothetical protein